MIPLFKYTFGFPLVMIIMCICFITSVFVWDIEYIRRGNKIIDYFVGEDESAWHIMEKLSVCTKYDPDSMYYMLAQYQHETKFETLKKNKKAMAKIKTKIELDEKDVLAIVAEKYNIKSEGATINIYKYESGNDPRERDYTTITIEGEKSL